MFFFTRDKLLNQYDGWGNLVKTDLLTMPDDFDVLPLVDKMYELLKDINEKLKSRIREHYRDDAHFLLSLLPQLSHLVGVPCLIKMEETDVIKVTFRSFPFDHISQITGATFDFKYIHQE